MVPVTALAVIFLMGTGVYAYESPNVGEGHPLFPVKRGIEQVEGAFTKAVKGPQAAAKFDQWVEQRREQETQIKVNKLPLELRQQLNGQHARAKKEPRAKAVHNSTLTP